MNNIIIYCASKIINSNSAGASRVQKYVKIFAELGYRIYFSNLTTSKISLKEILRLDSNVFEIKSPVLKRRQFVFYNFFNSFIYLYRLITFENKLQGETIFLLYPSTDPTLELPSVVLLKWVYKHRVICEINELRRSIVKNFIPHRKRYKNDILRFSNFIRYYYYRFNEILTKYFDGLIVISTNLETYYKKYNNNIIRIPILSDKFEDNTPRKSFISINDPFIISFTGQIDLRKEGIDILFKALSLLKGDFRNFKLFLYGPVSRNDKEILEGLAKRLGIQDDIVFKGIVPQHQIHKILIESHLLLLLRPNNLQNQYGFSTKLAEYLVSGTPVLISAVSDNTLYIKDGENGFVVNEMNENEIASKLFWIIINYTKVVETIKYNSLKTADEIFHYKNYVQIFKRFIPGQ